MGNGANNKPAPAGGPGGGMFGGSNPPENYNGGPFGPGGSNGYVPNSDPVANARRFPTYQAQGAPIGRAPVNGAQINPYQQGQNQQQQQAGLGRLTQGMNLAQQSYNQMGQQGQKFDQNAQNAGNAAFNPAIGAYQQAMNQNSQNIGSQLASQRGSSADPGLAARNVGQQGALAAQNAAGQMSSQVAQFKESNQQAAANAYQGQGQMANTYGNIANAYSQAGLADQGQILNALAAQNAAQVAMQSNINSSNVAMQGNINDAGVGMQSNINSVMAQQNSANNGLGLQQTGMGMDYNAAIYRALMGYQGARDSGAGSGGTFGHGGFLGLGLAKGGVVGKHGTPMYAKGGQVPQKMSDGGAPSLGVNTDLSSMGGSTGASSGLSSEGSSPFNLGVDTDLSKSMASSNSQPSFFSQVGKAMMGSMGGAGGDSGGGGGGGGKSDGGSQMLQMAMMAAMASKGGQIPTQAQMQMPQQMQRAQGLAPGKARFAQAVNPVQMRAQGGSIQPQIDNPMVQNVQQPPGDIPTTGAVSLGGPPAMAQGGQPGMPQQQPQGMGMQVQQQGPSIPNFALAGSPNPGIGMPSTGMPMGGTQTRGGAPMPGMGASGAMPPDQQQKQPGQMNRGGRVNGSRR